MLGLPGETRQEMLEHADRLSDLPLDSVKLHQLQIVKHTVMASQYRRMPDMFRFFGLDEYVDFMVDFLERLNPSIVVERFTSQSPFRLLIAPRWGVKNFEVVELVIKKLRERNTFQGRLYNAAP
jgi:radical SAM superfamily enzyme